MVILDEGVPLLAGQQPDVGPAVGTALDFAPSVTERPCIERVVEDVEDLPVLERAPDQFALAGTGADTGGESEMGAALL
ncbi:hypothetical protein GCM10009574_092230 [Streptomyces asiaticus]|uniref:Uncharacterized protein n=1 Tax=Streptomyces rhizosphaericus TaxID=114699 RepID=A0ABN1RA09_9ACTN